MGLILSRVDHLNGRSDALKAFNGKHLKIGYYDVSPVSNVENSRSNFNSITKQRELAPTDLWTIQTSTVCMVLYGFVGFLWVLSVFFWGGGLRVADFRLAIIFQTFGQSCAAVFFFKTEIYAVIVPR